MLVFPDTPTCQSHAHLRARVSTRPGGVQSANTGFSDEGGVKVIVEAASAGDSLPTHRHYCRSGQCQGLPAHASAVTTTPTTSETTRKHETTGGGGAGVIGGAASARLLLSSDFLPTHRR